MASYEDLLRQQLGLPIQNAANALGASADQAGQAAQMKLAALQSMGSNPQGSAAPNPSMAMQPQAQLPNVLPNNPSMSPQDAQNRMAAQVMAPQQMANAASKLKAQAALDQQAEDHANSLSDEDMSGYKDVNPQPRQFPHIQAKMKSGQPVTTQDIRATMKGPQEVTPDLMKKLGYNEDEDVNNKAGSSEGSYGD